MSTARNPSADLFEVPASDGDIAQAGARRRMGGILSLGAQVITYLNGFRRLIILLIGAFMALVVLLSAAQLGWTVAKDAFTPPHMMLSLAGLFRVLGTFALVLIAIELFETTLKAYAADVNHAELIIRVAIIAVARHAILIDYERAYVQAMVGLAATILSLTAGAYLLGRSRRASSAEGA